MERCGIPYLGQDHVKMGLIRGGMVDARADDSDESIAEWLWPITRGIIGTCLENGQRIIIEGCYMPFEFVRRALDEFPDRLLAFYIGFSCEYILQNYQTGILAHRNAIEHRKFDEERDITDFLEMSDRIRRGCAEHGLKLFEIQYGYSESVFRIMEWICDTLGINGHDAYVRS